MRKREHEEVKDNCRIKEIHRIRKISNVRTSLMATLSRITYCSQPYLGGVPWTSFFRSIWTYKGQSTDQGFHSFLSCHRLATSIHLPTARRLKKLHTTRLNRVNLIQCVFSGMNPRDQRLMPKFGVTTKILS